MNPSLTSPPSSSRRTLRPLCSLLLVFFFAFTARAQYTAPEGNAHPKTQMVSDGTDLAPPFGEPDRAAAPPSNHEKWAFAQKLDLKPLGDLAVLHNGRVKVLDTLARETISKITGKPRYDDFLHAKSGTGYSDDPKDIQKVSYPPVFTLLDLIIDPVYYADKPLLHINFLPLRREFLEAEFLTKPTTGATINQEAEKAKVERWMRLTRIAPAMMQAHYAAIVRRHESEPAYRDSMLRLEDAARLWQDSAANMLLVAPDAKDEKWTHISALPDGHPMRVAAAKLGSAWRARDAAAANAAIIELAEGLPKIHPDVYPAKRRQLEIAYNRLNAFEWGYWLYFGSLVSLLIAFGTGRKWLAWLGSALLFGAVALHATGFILRCVIAERFAIQNQFESMTGLSLFAAAVGLAIMLASRKLLFGAATAGVGFLVLVTATQTKIPGVWIEREAAILNTSVLLKYHVTTVLVSYGLIALGFIVSLFYLGTHYFARQSAPAVAGGPGLATGPGLVEAALGESAQPAAGRARVLKDLDSAQMTVLQLAFWTLGVGILLGAWWADHSWGRWWAFDPKETWALITWIVYLIVIHTRFATGKDKGLTTAWLSVLGFVVMLWTYFGVNLLLPGLHAYA